ncbi:Glutamate decarboxylase B [Penicillium subrubescens]|uniref:glutamate decarboxylase n=1 Tax=Penicillium subrubescens TaxID=1316194 RepID=A0A1Q5ULZ5_9EURO|nr:Glutamate decarboxylase B [Penicillium subrubescens]
MWSAPSVDSVFGTATTSSSEAVLLAGLAFKHRWQLRHHDQPQSHMNVIIGEKAHICVKKFADYFDVKARFVPANEQSRFIFDVDLLKEKLDENTSQKLTIIVGVFLTLGSTYTGHYDPIEAASKILDEFELQTGHSIPIRADAASGGFIAPFTAINRSFVWDFHLRRVASINTSGHKFGLTPLGVGWLVWRDKSNVPDNLLLVSSYLRGTQTAFTLSFSRSAIPVTAQYFNFYSKGIHGYRAHVNESLNKAQVLSEQLEHSGYFACLSDIHGQPSRHNTMCKLHCTDSESLNIPGLPIVVFRLCSDVKKNLPELTLSDISDVLRTVEISIPNGAKYR